MAQLEFDSPKKKKPRKSYFLGCFGFSIIEKKLVTVNKSTGGKKKRKPLFSLSKFVREHSSAAKTIPVDISGKFDNLSSREIHVVKPEKVKTPTITTVDVTQVPVKGQSQTNIHEKVINKTKDHETQDNIIHKTNKRNVKNLTILQLHDNQLTGTIPASFGNLGNLHTLYLRVNKLSGSIPKELAYLDNLVALALGANQFSGHLSEQLCQDGKLEIFTVTSNKLTGLIPKSLSNCSSFIRVRLERRSLNSILNNKVESKKLDWLKRVNIIKGVAFALSYMHQYYLPPIIHQDISSSNVLLDSEYEARVPDFVIAKLLKRDSSNCTALADTYGYVAPGKV
ncbi:hypothetical protein K7X08_001334 [Anisodus acutangulus]|uniref:non-specific serine/threonine protein kinase n=1 Tax=Anisodus acutangulus TaxID=402998 RepID=A0A9Q1RMX8_9SOLA|nr:hypothetical protein K7X08_001334 [Anisodus acutangulus]